MNKDKHGGECCGIRHIYNLAPFFKAQAETLKESVTAYQDPLTGDEDSCILLEAVTADYQEKQCPLLVETLKECGFRVVSKLKNRNTNNMCKVWHLYTKVR